MNKELDSDYKNTLLFIDEIQESPKAIGLLRYFAEDLPELHVISAGSLLEFSINQVKSFPVGRIQYLNLFPLNFREFLMALGKNAALNALDNIPVSSTSHDVLIDYFHKYAIIGGMPEIVKKYVETGNYIGLNSIYEGIWTTYKNDVRKYAKNSTEERVITHIINTAFNFLDQRITFQNFGNSNYRSREVGEAFRCLDDARVIQLVYPTAEVTFPVKSDLKKKHVCSFWIADL